MSSKLIMCKLETDYHCLGILLLLRHAVPSNHASMIPFIRLQGQLLSRLELLLLKLRHLLGKHGLRRHSGIDTVGLDTDHKVTSGLEEVVGVESHNTSLRGLVEKSGEECPRVRILRLLQGSETEGTSGTED
eukprot:TRINITY_DN5257_c0_g1_i3.p3 TRINITY_DN5257_c0_g1~~TRINITY_DN5257_c0_g1_i3.p3  ORF type:complete len:132 (+),score=1.98 TRINITY_DN5257_c0_g1_i3:63-458(+)